MRFKKAPLRSGGELTNSKGGEGRNGTKTSMISASEHEMEQKPDTKMLMARLVPLTNENLKAALSRPRTYGNSTRKGGFSSPPSTDEETQEAQAKLRQYEALGLIKVEVDEHQDHLEPTPQPSTISNNCQPTTVQCQNQGSNNVVLYTIPQSTFVQQPQGTLHVAQKGGSGVIDVPSFKDMKGEYDFTVSVEEKERTTKSPMWLMSKITNKLYTNINKAVPFEVRMNKNAQRRQFYVRSTVVFSSVQFRLSNVMRCPNHASPSDATNHEFPYPEHVVRADHPDAKYLTSPCGRLSVRVPLDATDGLCYAPILLRFMCLGSCVGGINRRPIAIILTLEDREGVACGRKVIDVRVCACPTRDIKTDEAAFANKGPKRKSSVLGHQDKTTTVVSKKPKNVEIKSERNEDDCLYNIPVRGKKLYDFLTKMKAVYYQTHPEYAAKYPDDLIRCDPAIDAFQDQQ
ncbi:induces growth arrest or apoptosis depending on the physiological circumstances and cell type [Halocaridina rubra]|uniref:Induces growth arrest or apoptosis depending on the physiological circumstances and cell type n=1 Tax=Halocaridina rubra TaxID=373956 RepID=A0AAN8WEC1_HALRR